MQSLKRIRVVVAVIFMLACTLLSLDLGIVLPIGLHTFFTSTQLIPSFLRTLVVLTVASLGLFFILAVTLFFGRVYCSAFCPLGILQDGIIRIAKRINKRRRFHYKKPSYLLQYSLFILIVICTIFGSAILLDLFEPYSNYSRIISLIFNPMVHLLNNGMEYILGFFGINIFSRVAVLPIHVPAVLASLSFLVFIIYLSYRHGRLFCNLLCPAGAFLSLFSRFSLFEIIIDKNNCKECGLCERVCKAQCIQSSKKEIDFAACIGCFNCIDACPTVGMSYRRRWRKISNTSEVNTGRRKVLKISILPALGLLMQKTGAEGFLTAEKIGYEENKKNPVSPPGSKSIERFANLCTA
jgi:polyferredoxin